MTSPRISRRVSAIAESATLAVDARARALKAQGRPVIGFGVGEPDFDTPPAIVEAAVRAARDPRYHHYSPVAGLPELREAIAAVTWRDDGYRCDARQVLVTNGGKQAVYQAFATLLDPGDEVLVPTPYWTTYPEAIRLAGGVPVLVTADEAQGYRVDVEQLEAARTERTKVLLFVSPSNPTGAVYDPAQTRALGAWAAEHDLWVLTDEIYQHLTYGNTPFTSVAAAAPEIGDRLVILNGLAKAYAMTGWRVGWLVGAPDVVAAASNLQSHSTSNVANVSQAAALAALTGGLDDVHRMRDAFDRRRHRTVELLREVPGVICPEPAGAFYAYPQVKELVRATLGPDGTSAQLATRLLDQAEVAVVPGEAFGTPGYLRLSYALAEDQLVEGLTRLRTFAETQAS